MESSNGKAALGGAQENGKSTLDTEALKLDTPDAVMHGHCNGLVKENEVRTTTGIAVTNGEDLSNDKRDEAKPAVAVEAKKAKPEQTRSFAIVGTKPPKPKEPASVASDPKPAKVGDEMKPNSAGDAKPKAEVKSKVANAKSSKTKDSTKANIPGDVKSAKPKDEANSNATVEVEAKQADDSDANAGVKSSDTSATKAKTPKKSSSSSKQDSEKPSSASKQEKAKAASAVPQILPVTSRDPVIIPKSLDDPGAIVGLAYRVKRAYEKQQREIKEVLLEEQTQRIRAVEALIPSRTSRLMRVVDRRVKEAMNKKLEDGLLELSLPEEYVPDALEVWAFCQSHEKSLRIKIGTFRAFEQALLQKEPNATFDAVAVGLLTVINAKLLGKVTKSLVNELTWPEVARRTLIFISQTKQEFEAAPKQTEEGEENDGDGGDDETQSRSITELGEMDILSNEASSQNDFAAEDDSEETPPTWREFEKDPISLFVRSNSDNSATRPPMGPDEWSRLCKASNNDLQAVWKNLCKKDVQYRADLFERLRGVLNKVKADPAGKQVWSIDYRDCLKSGKEIPFLADFAAIEELVQAKYYLSLEDFWRDFDECCSNMERLLENKNPKEIKREFLNSIEHCRVQIRSYVKEWVLSQPPFALGPWTVWAKTDPQETTACRLCRGSRRFPKKTIPPLTLYCRTCEIPFHQDCYESFVTGQPIKPLLLKTQANLAAVAAERKRLGLSGSPRARDQQGSNNDGFQCTICEAMGKKSGDALSLAKGGDEPRVEDLRMRVWRSGDAIQITDASLDKSAKVSVQFPHNFWGGLRGGKETPLSLMRLANKLGTCEPADLDLRERLRLLLFLSREASATEACREEADAALSQIRDLQVDFNKCRKSWLDDCSRSLELSFAKMGHIMRRELKKKLPVFSTALEACREELNNLDDDERESIQEYFDRVRRFIERGGLNKDVECHLAFESEPNVADGNIKSDELGFTLDSDDESDVVPYFGEEGDQYDDETESEYDSDDSLVPPPTAAQAKMISSIGFETAIAQVNIKKFETFMQTLDPETIPEMTPLEIALAQSVNLGPSLGKMRLHDCVRLLPSSSSLYTHPATFGLDLNILHVPASSTSFDPTKTNPVFLGVSHSQKPKPIIPQSLLGGSTGNDDSADNSGNNEPRKRSRRHEGNAEAGKTGSENQEGGEVEVKRRRRRTKKDLGQNRGDGEDAVGILNPKLDICPLCALPFDILERMQHRDCQVLLDRMHELSSVSSEDRQLIHALTGAFFHAESESFASLMRCEPLSTDDSKRYWRFRGDLEVIYSEDMNSGRISIVQSGDNLPLKLKWLITGAGLKSPAVSKAKVITATFLSLPPELPIVLDPPRLRAQTLFSDILGSSRYHEKLTDANCPFCVDTVQEGEWHCLVCHQTFLRSVDEAKVLQHVRDCCSLSHPAVSDIDSIEKCLYGPDGVSSNAWLKFARLKQLIIDLEASVPMNATRYKIDNLTGEITSEQRTKVRVLVGGWESERRAMWIDRVRRCVTPLQLYKLVRMFEGVLDPRWVAAQSCLPSLSKPALPQLVGGTAVPTNAPQEPAATSTESGEAQATAAQQSSVAPVQSQEETFVDVVVAKVALKLFALDQDVRFEAVS